MSDLIDRQAAIDDLHGKDPSQIWDTADVEVWLNALPSVQQDHTADISKKVSNSCGHENDLISRQAAIDAMGKLYDADLEAYGCEIPEMFDCDRAIEALKELPSVQPDWSEMIVICDCCGHAIHVKRQ